MRTGPPVLGRRDAAGRVVAGQQPPEQRAGEPAEGASRPVAVQHGDLEGVGPQVPGLPARRVHGEGGDGEPERLGEGEAGPPGLGKAGRDLLGGPAHHDEAALVGDRAVVGQAVDLVPIGGGPDLRDDDLDLDRLGLGREDGAELLGVGVGQAAGGDVAAVVGVAAQVGVADAGHPQVLELVVLADRGEGDAVVDLADLVQGARGVLGREGDPPVVGDDDGRPAARDAFARVVGLVLHQLLG